MGPTVVPEAELVSTLSFKVAATEVEAPTVVDVRVDEGIVEAIVSITGIEDEVKDIIEPGAYKATLVKRRPKVIWHHNWEQPIGRILHIEELHPGDSRLPTTTKDGKPWPKKAGGLLATMQFNLKSERGREAFEAVRFYSETGECEWSIGYQAPDATMDAKGIRHIKTIDLYEVSFVLFGAASQTGTLGVKAAYEAAQARMEHKDAAAPADGADGDTSEATVPSEATPPGTEPVVAPTPDEVTPAGTEPVADPVPVEDDEPADDPTTESQDTLLGDDEDDPELAALLEGLSEEDVAGYEADTVELDEADLELIASFETKSMTPGGRDGDDSPVGKPGGRQNWVDKSGGLPKYIRQVAHALIRNGMSDSRAIATAVATMKRWAAGGGKVSAKVQAAAAAALAQWEKMKASSHMKKSAVESKALEWSPVLELGPLAAHRQTKTVSPSSFRDYPKIEGTFEERIEKVRSAAVEALQDAADEADNDGDETAVSKCHISIDGTWPDRVIATRVNWAEDSPDTRESFEMNYVIGEDGEVTLTDPEPVQLTVYVEPVDGDESEPDGDMGDLMGVPDMIESAYKAATHLIGLESKAGRVLSGVNESRVKAALESLIAIMRQAGIDIDTTTPKPPSPDMPQDMETTAPAAHAKKDAGAGDEEVEIVRLDPADLAAQLAALRTP